MELGSGKLFSGNDLVNIITDNNFKPLYVSLNGISKIEAIETSVILKIDTFYGNQENKKAKTIITLVTNAANSFSKNLLKTSLTDIL